MAPTDVVYCEQCGGASPRRATACRFCGAPLPPPRAPVRPPPSAGTGPAAAGSAVAASTGSSGPPDDDPWAELHEPDDGAPTHHEHEPWVDPDELPWRGAAADDPATGGRPAFGPPAAGEPAGPPTGDLPPTQAHGVWSDAELIEPVADEPRRGLPGWAWVASVVLLGTLLGVGAYIVVDQADDGSVRTEEPTTSTSTTSSTTTTTVAPTSVAPTAPPTTAPIVPATPPATAPDSGPPTVPGAVTAPTTLAPTTVPTTPAPTTPAPTTPPPTTAAPTTPAPTTMPPTTPAPTTPGTVPGDLGIPGTPMAQLPCDGTYVTFLASVKNTTASAMQEALASFPGSQYLRTDQTCPSLNAPASDGAPLYRIFAGPYGDVNEACAARAMSSQGAFVKRVSNGDPPAHVVTCP